MLWGSAHLDFSFGEEPTQFVTWAKCHKFVIVTWYKSSTIQRKSWEKIPIFEWMDTTLSAYAKSIATREKKDVLNFVSSTEIF